MNDAQIRYQLTVNEAAARLGISEGAVRQRIRRGSLETRRKGRRLVVLLAEDDVPSPTEAALDAMSDRTVRTVHDNNVAANAETSASQTELASANQAYDELAQAWARDLRHQLERLEREVDRLQGELSAMRERHAEEIRRKDILLQGNQEALMATIGRITGPASNTPRTDD